MKLVIFISALIFNVHFTSAFSFWEFFQDLFNINQPAFKLSYFNLTSRGEFIRFIFSYAGQPFEDNRINSEDWPGLKPTTPFGQLPVLEIKKRNQIIQISQSQAIARYLANRFGLAGENDLENAFLDMYGEQIGDLFDSFLIAFNKNITDEFISSTWTQNFGFFEKRINQNGHGVLVGRNVKWIDVYLSQMTDFLGNRKTEILEKFPGIKELDKIIRNNPGIAKWIQQRSNSTFIF